MAYTKYEQHCDKTSQHQVKTLSAQADYLRPPYVSADMTVYKTQPWGRVTGAPTKGAYGQGLISEFVKEGGVYLIHTYLIHIYVYISQLVQTSNEQIPGLPKVVIFLESILRSQHSQRQEHMLQSCMVFFHFQGFKVVMSKEQEATMPVPKINLFLFQLFSCHHGDCCYVSPQLFFHLTLQCYSPHKIGAH